MELRPLHDLSPHSGLGRIAAFIPLPHRHRRHYFGVFAPNSPLRKLIITNAQRRPENFVVPCIKKVFEKINKISLDWAKLIARIYEVDPLRCSKCGEKIKITGFVTNRAEIYQILRRIGWAIQLHEFDPPYDLQNWDICQLVSNTADGFSEIEVQVHSDTYFEAGTNSLESYSDPPHWNDYSDPPHECD